MRAVPILKKWEVRSDQQNWNIPTQPTKATATENIIKPNTLTNSSENSVITELKLDEHYVSIESESNNNSKEMARELIDNKEIQRE